MKCTEYTYTCKYTKKKKINSIYFTQINLFSLSVLSMKVYVNVDKHHKNGFAKYVVCVFSSKYLFRDSYTHTRAHFTMYVYLETTYASKLFFIKFCDLEFFGIANNRYYSYISSSINITIF